MKETRLTVSKKTLRTSKTELAVILYDSEACNNVDGEKTLRTFIKEIVKTGDFSNKKNEAIVVYPSNDIKEKYSGIKRFALVSTGDIPEGGEDRAELLRSVGGTITATGHKYKCNEISVVIPESLQKSISSEFRFLAEGIMLGDYRFDKYKKESDPEKVVPGLKKVTFINLKRQELARKACRIAAVSSRAVYHARDMANEPGNHWTPDEFAQFAREVAASSGLKCKVLEKHQINKLGMGGIIAVNQGSAVPPKLVILEHKHPKAKTTLLLVGKGLTFDSGGISLKPAAGMQDMKYDMCGGAAVLAAMSAIAVQKPSVNVIGMVPTTENLSGAKALKPGDIISHYNGVTSEIINTDAEGRLILADALSYGIEKFQPDYVVDLATLTGAVVIALGHHHTGLVSNSDTLSQKIEKSAKLAGEPVWRLPLNDDYRKQIDSTVADIKNMGGRPAGSITAGAYLEKFVGDTKWAHLDIAGTAWDFTKKTYIPKGPSGVGVRTILELVRNLK
ncbi:MAG: leucyl aminopeptidase [Desulfobulbaceae bacterium]|nr:MAG: leucyl aminopeptidase [Desulfobulbaceae bacterium]